MIAPGLIGIRSMRTVTLKLAGYNILRPGPEKSIPFLDMMGDNTYEEIQEPTRIKVLDPLYPDDLEGWGLIRL